MANNIGTLVSAAIRPASDQDTFPSAFANELLGGWQSAATTTARDAIPTSRRLAGMCCFVEASGTVYQLVGGTANSDWKAIPKAGSGAGGVTLDASADVTVTIPATGTVPLGTGAADRVAVWSSANALSSSSLLAWDSANGWLGVGGAPSRRLHVPYITTQDMVQFGSVAWALRFGSLQAGHQFLCIGVEKTGADNNYKAQTGNNSLVNHIIQDYTYTGLWRISGQAHQTDGTTLSPTFLLTVDVVNQIVSIGGILTGAGLRVNPASPSSKEIYVDSNGFLKRAA